MLSQIPTAELFERDPRLLNHVRASVPAGHSSPCPFGHRALVSSLNRLWPCFVRVPRGPVRVSFYYDCKETRAMFPGLLISIESFDTMLGRVLARTA